MKRARPILLAVLVVCLAGALVLWSPWSRGRSPVMRLVIDGTVHGAGATALGKSTPRRASACVRGISAGSPLSPHSMSERSE